MPRKKNILKHNGAQTMVEYTIMLGLIVTILAAMQAMIQRGTQAMIAVTADQIGVQKNADQISLRKAQTGDPRDDFDRSGYLESAYTSRRSSISKERQDFLGTVSYLHDDTERLDSNATINLGFTEDQQRQ